MPVIVLKVEKAPRRGINRGIQWDNGAVQGRAVLPGQCLGSWLIARAQN